MTGFSQQNISGVPYSAVQQVEKLGTYELMPSYSQSKASLKSEQVSGKLKSLEFAHVFNLNYSPENSGEWITFNNGDKLWRIGLVSQGAYSLNIILERYQLSAGIKLYVYTPNLQHLLGAYSERNNNPAHTLAIEPLPGDSIVVELNMPANSLDYGSFEISKLGHDYINIFGSTKKSTFSFAGSGPCNMDINCQQGFEWQTEKYAVCKLIVEGKDLCTGTLVNNTTKDFTPYVLTANHCIDILAKAAATVFIFNYEKWKCDGLDGPKPLTISGSQLMATSPNLDFSLVKLYGLPPFKVRPYFAGWDKSAQAPLRSATIHHPNGDFKKITIDNDPAISATFPDDYLPNTHWMINKWEIGTTERGSSGSPLFNHDHLVVGDLTGGDANCVSPVKDYFAKLSSSWAYYPETAHQLKHWLDPNNTDSIAIMGIDPYKAEVASCDTFRNIGSSETIGIYSSGLTWGNYSGHNSQLVTQFAEKIDVGGVLKIPGFYLHIAKAYNASPLSFITINLWKGNAVPEEEITSKSIFIKDLTPNQENYLEFDSTIFISGPVFLGYAVNYSASQDTFALYQAQDRGVSGPSGMFVYKNGEWRNIAEASIPAMHSSLAVGLISCSLLNGLPKKELLSGKLHIYPNPVTSGTITVELPFLIENNSIVSITDLSGRKRAISSNQENNAIHINTSDLPPGIYILNVLIPGKGSYNGKFMVLK